MRIKLISYGIARDILGGSEQKLELSDTNSIGELKQELVRRYPAFDKLTRFSIAVNEEYREEAFLLSDGDEVVIIPPVSGG